MQNFASRATDKTISIHAVTKRGYKKWLAKQPKTTRHWLESHRFSPAAGRVRTFPARDGSLKGVVLGLGDDPSLWAFAAVPGSVPRGRYAYAELPEGSETNAALAWALATYRFDRYKKSKAKQPTLVWPEGCDVAHVERAATATFLGRDLINTPAGDLGPAELASAAKELAKQHGATCKLTKGKALLDQGYPAVHAVGRGAARAPHLADIRWGDGDHPKLTLVGKGVVFDTGGLDLKSAAGMKLMKKDMGGAASVLALAHMIMDAKLPVRLRVLVPCVENGVTGDAYHPMDVLQTRKGITVEVGNTDAEGRLILSDCLTEADSEGPDLLIDFATLTGAARVALGTELPALFCNDDSIADGTLANGIAVEDPLWRMPLHDGYRRLLDSKVADINNIASVSQGGAITAALFLREFIDHRSTKWIHVDTMAFNNSGRPGRPAGGELMGVRGMYAMLVERYAPAPESDGSGE